MPRKKAVGEVVELPKVAKKPPKANPTRTDSIALSPEARENQMVNKAVALAERQLEDGTASAAVITHYLKLATNREKLEREILQKQAEYLTAKASSITQAKDAENLAMEAIEAMKSYTSSN